MTDRHALDLTALGTCLEQAVPGFSGLQSAEKFPGGQSNPTYRLMAESGAYVLRRKPPGKLLPSAHAVDREYRVLKALEMTDVPAAKAFYLCEDETVIGSMFYVMEYVEAEIFWDPSLPDMTADRRRAIYDDMNATLAAIHKVDLVATGLSDFGKPGNYFERQLARWTQQYRASETDTVGEMDRLMRWLEDNLVPDDGQVALVHGDYRIDNLMFEKGGTKVRAVVDWELSTLGHPLADLSYQCMQWHMPPNPFVRSLVGADLDALGIPSEAEYVAQYCARMGLDPINNWSFYLAFGLFRLAAIAQGVMKRAIDGNASNEQALSAGKLVRPLAATALGIIDKG